MLNVKRWRAAALTGLALGLACTPALSGTPVGKFLETVKSGWAVQVRIRSQNDRITSIRIAAKNAQADRFVDIAVNNGEVASTEIAKAVEFFDAEQVPVNPGSDRQADLVLQGLDFDRERPGSVPDGIKLRNEPDGSTSVTDQRGSVQGSIPKGASVAGKEEAVVSAVAKRSADGLISSRGRVLPAASPVLAQTAKMVREDFDNARNNSPGLLGNISAKQEQEYKDALVLLRLSNVQDKITAVLDSKGVLKNASMAVADLERACEENKFVFEPPGQDGWFAIRDPSDNNEVIAVGQLTAKGRVDAENLRSLNRQILDRPFLMKQIVRDTPDEMRMSSEAAATEVKNYMESESKTDPDPTKDPPKEDPETEDPNKGKEGDTSGPR